MDELRVLNSCAKSLSKLPSKEARQRVVSYLQGLVSEDQMPPCDCDDKCDDTPKSEDKA